MHSSRWGSVVGGRVFAFLSTCVVVVGVSVVLGSGRAVAAAPSGPSGVSASVQGLNIAVSWTAPADASALSGYQVTTVPAGPTLDVPAGADHAVLVGVRPNTSYLVEVASTADGQSSAPVPAPTSVTVAAAGGSFTAVSPSRLLDTRSGLGGPQGATQQVTLQVTGRGGVPATGAAAVALNVTVTGPAGSGYVTVYPAGSVRPTASNLNVVRGLTVANLVVVPLGPLGQVALYSSTKTHLIADVAGWFSTGATASPSIGLFHGLSPSRLVDTRTGSGGVTPGAGGVVAVQVTGVGGVPAAGVTAVVLNTTVVGSSAAGYVTAYPAGQPRPTASTVNFTQGAVVANRVLVPVGAGGVVDLYNAAGNTPLLVDVTGWFTDGSDGGAGGAYFAPVSPTRIVDTRAGLGAPAVPVAAATALTVIAAGHAGIPASTAGVPATGLIANVTAVHPTANGYLTVFPSLSAQPTASDLNFTAGATVPNLAIGSLGVDGDQLIYNSAGSTDLLVDVVGYFVGEVAIPSTTLTAAPGEVTDVTGTAGASQQVTLAAGTPVPAVGDVLAAGVTPQTPDGLLAQVTDTTTDAQGRPILTTEPASFTDAFGAASFSISAPLSSTDVTANRVPGARELTPALLRARLAGNAAISPVTQPINKAVTCLAGGSITVTGSVGLSLSVNLSVDWSWLSLHGATFTSTLSEDAALSAAAHAAAGCSAGPIALLATPIRFAPITFSIGPVPVVITPQLQFYLSASGTISADVTASATQHASGTLGVAWQNGSLSPIASTSSSFTYNPPAAGITATVTASVGPHLDLYLYGVAGPYLSADAGVDLDADPSASPAWTLTGTLDAGAGVAIPELDFDKSDPSILHYQHVIAQAPLPAGSWLEDGFGADRTGVNPTETTVTTGNVTSLHRVWQYTESAAEEFSPPVVAGGVAFIVASAFPATANARLVAVNLTTGARVWQRNLTGTTFLSPVLAGADVVVQTDRGVFAYTTATGAPVWSNTAVTRTRCGASNMDIDGSTLYAFTDTTVYALNATNGTIRWNTTAPVFCFSGLAAAGGRLFAVSRSVPDPNDNQTGQMRALNTQTGAVLWTVTTPVTIDGSPATGNGLVYAATQYEQQGMIAFDATTGHIRWQRKDLLNFDQGPAVTANAVIVTSEDGATTTPQTVRAVNPLTGATIWTRNIAGALSGSQPAIANGVIYVGSADSSAIYAVRLDNGTLITTLHVGADNGGVEISPIIVSGTVLASVAFSDKNGNPSVPTLQAFRLTN